MTRQQKRKIIEQQIWAEHARQEQVKVLRAEANARARAQVEREKARITYIILTLTAAGHAYQYTITSDTGIDPLEVMQQTHAVAIWVYKGKISKATLVGHWNKPLTTEEK